MSLMTGGLLVTHYISKTLPVKAVFSRPRGLPGHIRPFGFDPWMYGFCTVRRAGPLEWTQDARVGGGTPKEGPSRRDERPSRKPAQYERGPLRGPLLYRS